MSQSRSSPKGAAPSPFERVAKWLGRQIVLEIAGKHLLPGAPLPTESELGELYGVSRASVREALRLLEAQGLVEIRRGTGGGNFVGSPTGADFGETLTMYLQVAGTTVRQLYEASILFEGSAAYKAAARVRDGAVDAEVLGRLAAILDREAQSELGSHDLSAGEEFHDLLYECAGNLIVELVVGAAAHLIRLRAGRPEGKVAAPEQQAAVHAFHKAIADAVLEGDPLRARSVMEEHIADQLAHVEVWDPASLDPILDWR